MTCPRLWSVEAARDGRLTGAEAAAVARHVPDCVECRDRAREHDALREGLRSLPVRAPDALSARRAKQRLLADADAALVAAGAPRRRITKVAVGTLVAAAAAASLVVFLRWPAPSTPLAASVQERGGARFTRTRAERTETIVLSDGALSVHVRRTLPDQRVIVVVPDGEIEDEGTTFLVVVAHGFTERVEVADGAVVLRRLGLPPVRIAAGEIFRREADVNHHEAGEPSPATAASAPEPRTEDHVGGRPSPRDATPSPVAPAGGGAVRAREVPTGSRPRPAATSGGPVAPTDFEQGFRALQDKDDARAAARLGAASESADDRAKAEDAAYLQIIALARAGDHEKTRAAAKEYLARFPDGFRRREVLALLK